VQEQEAKPEAMKQEIERKFLVKGNAWRARATSARRLRQGYLCVDPGRTVRVRVAGDQAWLTIKGASTGAARAEYEYPLPLAEANRLLDELCLQPIIDKTRHLVPHEGLTFEVDVFHGENDGLVLAELELEDAGATIALPAWIGAEVTGDERYFNAYLVRRPFKSWSQPASL